MRYRSNRTAVAVVAVLMALAATVGVPQPAAAATVQNADSVADILSAQDYSAENHAPILRLYQAIFDRAPDVGGAKYWIDINNQGNDVLAIAGFMSASQEWTNNYAGTTDQVFLSRVYSNVLGRDFDQAGFDYWLDTLQGTNNSGGNPEAKMIGRHEVVFYVTANPEFTNAYPFASTFVPPAAPAGSGGKLRLLQWQTPSTANPYVTTQTRDLLAGSLVLEPLAEVTPNGELRPVLARTIPTIANGGVAADRRSITWQLKEGVVWSDLTPLTANDVVFSWEFSLERSLSSPAFPFDDVVSVVATSDTTVVVTFTGPQPYPYRPFVGYTSPVIQKRQFVGCFRDGSPCTDESLSPIGTGPFSVTQALPEDKFTYLWNPSFRGVSIGQPFFESVEISGGGFAEGTARSVLETGEADYAWNLQVAPETLDSLLASGIGRLETGYATNVEHLNLNQTDPNGSPRSEFSGGANPFFFENPKLQRALSLAIDRTELASVYGAAGKPTCNFWLAGDNASTTNDWCLTQDIVEANRILDVDLGYLDTDGDGVRELPDGTPLSFDFVTSTNAVRQSTQALIKNDWDQIGVATTMQNVDASLFFDGTCSTDSCIWKSFTDIQMFTNGATLPNPADYLGGFSTEFIPTSNNGWVGNNIARINNPALDQKLAILATLPREDPGYDQLVIEVNEIISTTVIPLVHRGTVSAVANSIQNTGALNGWDSEYYNIEEWTRAG